MARAAKLDLRVFQRELATRLNAKTAAQVASSRLGFACGEGRWLVRLADAGEVVPLPSVAAVPLTRPWYLGIANIRGNLYSVVDFARFLGHATGAVGSQARLVLFGPRTGGLNAGLVVPQVLGLRNVAELAPAGAADDAADWYGARWMDGNGEAWQEIDLAALARDPAFLQVGL